MMITRETLRAETRHDGKTRAGVKGPMLDIISSPLRGYIAQNLQFYLSKYIEGIQLEGLGLFGGDLVLNDLEIKRHVLMVSEQAIRMCECVVVHSCGYDCVYRKRAVCGTANGYADVAPCLRLWYLW